VAASPAQPTDGDAGAPRATSLIEWLRGRTDRQLTRLLRLRPDLALPSPADLAGLAGRISVRSSTQRAIDGLDAFLLRALEGLVLAADDADAVADPRSDGLDELFDRALAWGDAELVHLTPAVRESLGPYPAGLGRPAAVLLPGAPAAAALRDPQRLAELIAAADAEEREILERLSTGPPVGTVRNTRAVDDDSAPLRLIARGLLAPLDAQRVELPREVGQALRAATDGVRVDDAQPPQLRLVEREPAQLDRLGTTAVLEFLRLLESLADSWTAQPPPLLRSGGVGVRELRRTARDLGVDEATTALVVEVAYAAGLVNSTNGPEPAFLPTAEYDAWLAREPARRWMALASAWLAMTRQPSLVNQRGDRDRVISALGPDAERGTMPALRQQVLDLLTGLSPGSAPGSRDDVLDRLAWHQPRRASGQRALAAAVLAEADLLGVTAAGGLTGYTRTLLARPAGGALAATTGSRHATPTSASPSSASSASSSSASASAEYALAAALPEPVDHFLVQPDLTIVVPGPPEPALGAELGLVADLESTGGANVYRITERSVRRALDAGRSGERLAGFVERHSRTPIPQALRYLIDDSARRHGILRTGAASSYLRCDDEALLARVVADRASDPLHLRLLAPTVVVSDAPVSRVLEVLRSAGYSPGAEAPGGELITLGADPPRAPARPPARPVTTRGAADSDVQLAELVRRIRSGDALAEIGRRVPALAAQVPGVTSAATMELLRRAVREEQLVWLGVADPGGAATAHEIHPISLAAGYVRGYERGREGLVSFPVHRITAVRVVDDEADE
jgi:hypothetical protein